MPHNTDSKRKKPIPLNSGFGLVELMVSIGIVVLITSIIVSRHSSYNGAVLLRSQAYEVALQAREVQLSAVSAIGNAGDFRSVFGLYFDTTTPNYYLYFRDSNGNHFYDSGEEIGKRNNIDPRFEISDIRSVLTSTKPSESDISIVFERPNFDARFFTAASTEAEGTAVEIDVRVKGTTGTGVGEVRTVEITRTGQIVVQ